MRHGQQSRRTGRATAPVECDTSEEQCHPRKIFVGGLAHRLSTQQLREHFGQYGTVVDAVVLRWPDGRSRGFGYVTFGDAGEAARALQKNHTIGGCEVDVKRAVPGTNKLFVGGLPRNATANELREHFERFGVVSDAVVMIDVATNRSRGFGFVCFLPGSEGADAVAKAMEQYSAHRLRGKWIEVKCAEPPQRLKSAASSKETSSAEEGDSSTRASSPAPGKAPNAPRDLEPRKVQLPQSSPLVRGGAPSPPPRLGLHEALGATSNPVDASMLAYHRLAGAAEATGPAVERYLADFAAAGQMDAWSCSFAHESWAAMPPATDLALHAAYASGYAAYAGYWAPPVDHHWPQPQPQLAHFHPPQLAASFFAAGEPANVLSPGW